MNKNINNIVELTEKELACVCGGNGPLAPEEILRRIKSCEDAGLSADVILKLVKRYLSGQ